jgi:CBS domain-containing protein
MVINLIEDAKAKAAAMFLHLSDILEKDIRDCEDKFVGNVWDISVKTGEIYPKVDHLIIRKGFVNRMYAVVPWSDVLSIEDDIMLKVKASDIKFKTAIKDMEFLLKRDIMDQQVVDTFNHKVRRVNDLHLLKVERDLVLAHVDIGMRSLMHRLGWESAVDAMVKMINKNSKYLKTENLVSWKSVQPVTINPASMTMKLSVSQKQLQAIPAADLGEIIFDLTPGQRMAMFRTLDLKTKAKLFENLDLEEQKAIVKELDKKELAQIVGNMSSDEAADLLEGLPQNTVKNLLTLIESHRAKKLSDLLGYSSDSAGGLMTTDFVSMSETVTVAEAIEFIKSQTKDMDLVPYIYIIDDKNHLKGVTSLRRLLFEDSKESVLKMVLPKTVYVYLNNSVKEVAYLMDKYKISYIPVIDENKVLHGVVAMDDVLSQVIAIAWRKKTRLPKGI